MTDNSRYFGQAGVYDDLRENLIDIYPECTPEELDEMVEDIKDPDDYDEDTPRTTVCGYTFWGDETPFDL